MAGIRRVVCIRVVGIIIISYYCCTFHTLLTRRHTTDVSGRFGGDNDDDDDNNNNDNTIKSLFPGCRDAAGLTRVVLAHKTNAPINQLGFLGFAVTHVRFSEETSGSGGPWSGDVPLPDVRLRLRTTTKPPRRCVSSYLTRKHSARVNHCLTRR